MKPAQLKTLRTRLNLTQTELAKALGVDRNTVTRWEMGLHPISPIAEKLLKLLTPASKK